MITTIILRVETDKPVADLLDKIAGRAYTIDGVADVTASLFISPEQHKKLEPFKIEYEQNLRNLSKWLEQLRETRKQVGQ